MRRVVCAFNQFESFAGGGSSSSFIKRFGFGVTVPRLKACIPSRCSYTRCLGPPSIRRVACPSRSDELGSCPALYSEGMLTFSKPLGDTITRAQGAKLTTVRWPDNSPAARHDQAESAAFGFLPFLLTERWCCCFQRWQDSDSSSSEERSASAC